MFVTGGVYGPAFATPAILSIQSTVAYGHVGNCAAVLPLQRLGFDVWPIHTVQLGHHPGYGRFAGHIFEAEHLATVLDGVLGQAPLAACVGMISGYLGDAVSAGLVAKARHSIRLARPDHLYLLDPVIGDDGPGIFVQDAVPTAIRNELLPLADIVTPNRFELAWLAEKKVTNLAEARDAAMALLDLGPKLVVATGLILPEYPDHTCIIAIGLDQAFLIATPRLSGHFSGTGDAFSALFLGHYLQAIDLRTALERAAAAIFTLVETTARRGDNELSLIAAQNDMTKPESRFPAISLD